MVSVSYNEGTTKGGVYMAENLVITIGREYGSGGREIGRKLAETLGIKFYDKELIDMAAKESGMSKEVFEKIDETAASSLLYSIVSGTYMIGNHMSPLLDLPINDKLFILESDIIKEIAAKESCVIVGRCADYILRDYKNCINIFIHAPLKTRIEHAITQYNLPAEKAEQKINKIDKKRGTYYNYYTGNKWGQTQLYELSVDSSVLGIDATAEFIKGFIQTYQATQRGREAAK